MFSKTWFFYRLAFKFSFIMCCCVICSFLFLVLIYRFLTCLECFGKMLWERSVQKFKHPKTIFLWLEGVYRTPKVSYGPSAENARSTASRVLFCAQSIPPEYLQYGLWNCSVPPPVQTTNAANSVPLRGSGDHITKCSLYENSTCEPCKIKMI